MEEWLSVLRGQFRACINTFKPLWDSLDNSDLYFFWLMIGMAFTSIVVNIFINFKKVRL